MHTDRVTVARHRFASLHESGCFVMPNPWDRGSARLLASMGFEALATSSAGLSFALGRPDRPDALALDEVLRNIADVVAASDLPVNADFQAGYGDSPDAVAHSVARCIATGVAGLSIEDASGDASAPLFALDVALERLRAARAAIDESGAQV
ncbi:MAG: isocitrate lyase/phosphoenolpyruvate mutase family protein, partial [Myxococcales bacterium]|nr:isocitrate lyase/phosphoenolpyruvate mutase family protein [Myxococcales bacterium]